MSNKVFVGGLAWATDDHALQSAFEAYGNVTEAKVISDRETGRSRGFGFVTFSDADGAAAAIAAMDGSDLDGRTIRVNLAEDKPRRDNNRGGRGGGGQRW
jgi:RNA recognition motif-containing protein